MNIDIRAEDPNPGTFDQLDPDPTFQLAKLFQHYCVECVSKKK